MALAEVQDPTPNASLLAALYPSSSPNNTTKNFNQQSALQQGGTVGSISNQSATATGATSSQNGVNPAWLNNGSQNDVPNSSNSTGTGNTQNSQLTNPTTGSTTSQTNQGLAQANNVLGLNSGSQKAGNSGGGGVNPQGGDLGDTLSGLAGVVAKQLGFSSLKSTLSDIGSSITTGINDIGASLFGTGGGTAGYVNAAGDSVASGASGAFPVTAGQDTALMGGGDLASVGGSTASLTGLLGGAGVGAAVGSVYGSLVGLQGPNAGNADIGGAAGGAIGTAIFPGVGTAIGAIAGSILGGLFGPGAATSTAVGTGNLSKSGQVYTVNGPGAAYSSKNGDVGTAQKEVSGINSLFGAASSSLGIDFTAKGDLGVQAGYNTLHSPGGESQPGYLIVENASGKTNFAFNPSDSKSVSTAYFNALSTAAQDSGYTDSQALYNWFYGQSDNAGNNPTAANQSINIAPRGASNNGLSIATQGSNSNLMV